MKTKRTLLVELKEYNIDYEWEVIEEQLRWNLASEFCKKYNIPDDTQGKYLIQDYIGFTQIEDDFLEDVVKDHIHLIEDEFVAKTVDFAVELLIAKGSLSNRELEQALSKQYPTIIIKWNGNLWDTVEDILEYKGINYDADDDKETITLREAE